MKPEVVTRRIEAFQQRFGEAHFYFAYHAAFPLALTPDLLYRLWANFQRDRNGEALKIPWLAVADLLLSSLCDEVGYELYEMETEVRNALLKELKVNPRFGEKRIHELSDFLLLYVKQQLESHDPDMRDFAQVQTWTALAYTKPGEAARQIASTLASLKLEEKAEWVRMASVVETFAEPLAGFEPLLIYARGMASFARGKKESALAELNQVSTHGSNVEIAGVNLSIPKRIINPKPIFEFEYQVGGSLPSISPTYIMRQADYDLYEGLKAGEFCYVMNSRNMGKSSLRVRTMQRLQDEGVACAAIDITAIGTWDITPEQWYAGVIDSIIYSLHLDEKFDLESWWESHSLLSPVQRLSKFIEDVLLVEISGQIVIFVDEIDSIFSLSFSIDDFFALIRGCYSQRADNREYRRITFALLGVATPSELIQDKKRTPFNIGRAIELCGFQLQEVQPLAQGLMGKVSNPQAVMREVLAWTGGQPFLTLKLYKLIPDGIEASGVEELVRSRIIKNWESQDEPEHLRTIRDRIFYNKKELAVQMLKLYQQILQQGEVAVNDSPEQIYLQLSGLIVKQQGKLRVYNRIYEAVFNHAWVRQQLVKPDENRIDHRTYQIGGSLPP